MRFSFVTFLASLVSIQSLYAAPIEEIKQKSNPNEDHLSHTFSTGTAAALFYDKLLKRNGNQVRVLQSLYNSLTSTVDAPFSLSNISFKCHWENCYQLFDDATGLSKHVKQSHIVNRQKYYKCKWENCNFDCFQFTDLQRHLRKHTKERPFVCQIDGCGQSCTQNNSLKMHIKKHHLIEKEDSNHLEQLELNNGKEQKQSVLYCDWKNCTSEFNDVTLLSNHIKEDHIGSGKSRYECQWKDCSYATVTRNKMENHVRTHTKERPFICSYSDCGKSFIDNGNLKRHMKIHLDNSYFLCPLLDCDKKYSNIDRIRSHFRVHTAASNLSSSDVESIWNAFRKKIPYPADILNRIELKEQRFIEKNKKSNKGNENYSETSTDETEGNISSTENNEIYISDAGLHSRLSEVTSFDESVTSDKDNMESENHSTECISCTGLDTKGTELNAISKRPFEFDNNFDYASKRIKLTESDNSECDFPYRQEQNDLQNLLIPFSPLSLKTKLEQLFHSISNELDAENFIEQYLENE